MKFGDLLQSLTFNLDRVKTVSVDIYMCGNYKYSRNVQELQDEMKENTDKGLQDCEVIKWYMPEESINRFTVNIRPPVDLLGGCLLYQAEIKFPRNDIDKKKIYIVAEDKREAEHSIRAYAYQIFPVFFFNFSEISYSEEVWEFVRKYGAQIGVYEKDS